MQSADLFENSRTISSCANHIKVIKLRKEGRQTIADDRMVIRDEHANLCQTCLPQSLVAVLSPNVGHPDTQLLLWNVHAQHNRRAPFPERENPQFTPDR